MSDQVWSLTVSSMLSMTSAARSSVLRSPTCGAKHNEAAHSSIQLSTELRLCSACIMHQKAKVFTSSGFAIFEIISSRSLLKIGANSAWRLGETCVKEPLLKAAADLGRADLAGLLLDPEKNLCIHMVMTCNAAP